MRTICLQSGSSGNCVYVEAAGLRLLIDAGISGLQAQQRLARHGVEIAGIDALIITHDHADHARSMGIFQRKFGTPIYVTRPTLEVASRYCRLGQLSDVRHFQAGACLDLGSVRVETIRTPHDGVDGVAVVVDDGQRRLGVLTDLGHVFSGLHATLASLDAAYLESNHDPHLLQVGPYPEFLKERIRGPGGHISNGEAAELVAQSAGGRLRWLCLAHLSEDNNTPALALETHRQYLGSDLPIHVASRTAVMDPWTVS